MALTFRDTKGSPLTAVEADANVRQLQALATYSAGTGIAISAANVISSAPVALPAGTGTAVTFDVERRWPIITSGTYAVSATGATIDVCFQLILAVGCTAIALSGGQFVKLSATSFDATKENTYSFLVRFDGKIEYYISQPQ